MPKQWLSENEAFAFLAAKTEGRLATCAAGQPYITPLNYIFHRGNIYFHCAPRGHKLDNIAVNEQVCFEVSHSDKTVFTEQPCGCSTRYTSVVVFGRARVVHEEAERLDALNVLVERFAAGRPFRRVEEGMAKGCAVVAVSVDKISGKRNIDPETANGQ